MLTYDTLHQERVERFWAVVDCNRWIHPLFARRCRWYDSFFLPLVVSLLLRYCHLVTTRVRSLLTCTCFTWNLCQDWAFSILHFPKISIIFLFFPASPKIKNRKSDQTLFTLQLRGTTYFFTFRWPGTDQTITLSISAIRANENCTRLHDLSSSLSHPKHSAVVLLWHHFLFEIRTPIHHPVRSSRLMNEITRCVLGIW